MYEIPRWSKKPEQCKRILQTFSNINELSKEQIKCVVKSLQNRIYHIKGYSVFVLIIFKGLLHKLASDGKACRTNQSHKWLLFIGLKSGHYLALSENQYWTGCLSGVLVWYLYGENTNWQIANCWLLHKSNWNPFEPIETKTVARLYFRNLTLQPFIGT